MLALVILLLAFLWVSYRNVTLHYQPDIKSIIKTIIVGSDADDILKETLMDSVDDFMGL